jgi:YozE SAM-like fold
MSGAPIRPTLGLSRSRGVAAHALRRPQTFAAWLRAQRDRADPIGDLAADFCRDRKAPRNIRTARELLDYMALAGACHAARVALRDAAREFRLDRTA